MSDGAYPDSSLLTSTAASNPLGLIAILEPPNGQESDFGSTAPTNERPMIVLGAVLLAITSLFVANRVYFKCCVLRRRSWDDWTLAVGYVSVIRGKETEVPMYDEELTGLGDRFAGYCSSAHAYGVSDPASTARWQDDAVEQD